jgi:hypothetical protein
MDCVKPGLVKNLDKKPIKNMKTLKLYGIWYQAISMLERKVR